ncbi:GHKL domain-containing protein [Paenibacillus sp. GSMTC-2017]|uniref:sensor histidine kinase n=1 Tax=Paenibacillus sp. GSMTC-2017 TaxID=2794350 RepID=UPI0018D9584D|nr:GHKL domain-containing protein [Paenibacillus sp. GSMTC-2017]MBH5318506.1 GHKL domain-containing protein [Paenibacillus sp. GSMTC-2017]
MQRNMWLMAISVVIVLILINNTAYYYLTKQTLEDDLEQEMLTLGKQIELSVEQSRMGAEQFEKQIAKELRTAAIAAQYALDPDVEKVTNEQLKELSAKLEIDHISLLKRTSDDIILYRSSKESQLNKSTKEWIPWHSRFNQLFDQKEPSQKWLGQEMTNFWSGPFEVSATNTKKIYKWGYYFDGTTNYIIDPFVSNKIQEEYNRITGVDRLIHDLTINNESLLEITVMNPRTFPNGAKSDQIYGNAKEYFVQRPQLFGSYTIKSDHDVHSVREAYRTQEVQTINEWIGDRHIYKMFIPVSVEGKGFSITDENGEELKSYVLSIVSDHGIIQEKLDKQFLNLGLMILILTAASLIIAIVAMRYYKHSRDKAVRVAQETYTEEINSMFNSIRAQRHDFINHVQTIHSLAELNKYNELVAYTKELIGDIHQMNDIISIGNPAIAALIRSKISQAESYRINFQCYFHGLNVIGMGAKTLDINRILGNLIDNAFDEVLKYEDSKREVTLIGTQSEHLLELMISNTCENALEKSQKPLFDAGFSTKKQLHQGLGLSIVKTIAERYRGEASVVVDAPNKLSFIVKIPM